MSTDDDVTWRKEKRASGEERVSHEAAYLRGEEGAVSGDGAVGLQGARDLLMLGSGLKHSTTMAARRGSASKGESVLPPTARRTHVFVTVSATSADT